VTKPFGQSVWLKKAREFGGGAEDKMHENAAFGLTVAAMERGHNTLMLEPGVEGETPTQRRGEPSKIVPDDAVRMIEELKIADRASEADMNGGTGT
jgi:hypothetical protein